MMENLLELDDWPLIQQIQQSNTAALEEFYRRYSSNIQAFIRCRVQAPQELEEILAETMAEAVIEIMRAKGQIPVFPWLRRIAQLKLADFERNRNKEILPINKVRVNLQNQEEFRDELKRRTGKRQYWH